METNRIGFRISNRVKTNTKTGDNIGYPAEASGRIHFANMLNSTRQRMTKADVDLLIRSIGKIE